MSRAVRAVLAAALLVALSACAGGGAADTPRSAANPAGAETTTTLNLYAYAVPKVAYDELVPAFQQTEAGRGVVIQQSFGASGDQSRKVAAGAEADLVSLSVEPDITRLVDADLVDPDWNAGPNAGVPFGSVVTIVVRQGNPKNIRTWDDLLKPDVEVVTPNPFSSGSAKWNLLAPYATKSNGGANPQAGLDYVKALVDDHVKIQPKSGREATEAFLQGTGDALLSYENEALFIERKGDPVEHVTPDSTFRIDNPAAVLKNSKNKAKADQFNDYLYSTEGQRILGKTGFRPVDPAVAAEFADTFPNPGKVWTIDDLGGWKEVDQTLFKQGTGSIALIYDEATK